MQISVELSWYPLQDDYKPPIRTFIADLSGEAGISVIPGRMSTQVFGEYDQVMEALNRMFRKAFETYGTSVFVAKIMNSDRSPRTTAD